MVPTYPPKTYFLTKTISPAYIKTTDRRFDVYTACRIFTTLHPAVFGIVQFTLSYTDRVGWGWLWEESVRKYLIPHPITKHHNAQIRLQNSTSLRVTIYSIPKFTLLDVYAHMVQGVPKSHRRAQYRRCITHFAVRDAGLFFFSYRWPALYNNATRGS